MSNKFAAPVDLDGNGITGLGGTFGPANALNGAMADARYILSVSPLIFGAIGDGVADDTAAINAAISEVYARGGGVVRLMPKHRVAGTIVPRANVHIEGPCEIIVASTAPWRQTAGTQLYNASAVDITFIPASGFEGVEVVRLTCPQLCRYELNFENFNNAANVCFNLALSVVTTFEPGMRYPFNIASSAIFNEFKITGSVVGTLIRGKGVYGTTPTPSPAGSANFPIAVISANVWHVDAYFVLTKGVDCVGAWDSDKWHYLFVNLAAAGAVGFDLGSDASFTGNNYVNSHHFHLMLSRQAGITTGSGLRMAWTFGNQGVIEHDIGPASGLSIINDINSQGHNITTKATGVIDGSSNLLVETHQKNFFVGMSDGFATRPSYSFLNDRDTGFFRAGPNQIGVSSNGLTTALFDETNGQTLFSRPGNGVAQDVRARSDGAALVRFLDQAGSSQLARLALFLVSSLPVFEVGTGTVANGTLRLQGDFVQLFRAGGAGVVGAANDAAAAAAGVPIGGLYRNGNALQIRVV
jgi:hypothetical protein